MSPPPDALIISEEDLRELRTFLESTASGRDEEQLDRLQSELDRAAVVPRASLPADVVAMRATVEFENETTRRRQLVQLVYPGQADPAKGRVSVLAPIGAALLGLRVGQSLDWPLPSGPVRVRILRVTQQLQVAPPRLG